MYDVLGYFRLEEMKRLFLITGIDMRFEQVFASEATYPEVFTCHPLCYCYEFWEHFLVPCNLTSRNRMNRDQIEACLNLL